MKIHLLSDLHMEYRPYTYTAPPGGCDVIVLAGDICAPSRTSRLVSFLSSLPKATPVLMVAGNHDFYGSVVDERLAFLRGLTARLPNFHLLDCEVAEVDGVQFAGATLWTDFSLYGDRAGCGRLAEEGVKDFRLIHDGGHMTAQRMAERHRAAVGFLAGPAAAAPVVVTHFVPSPESIHPRYDRHPLNPYFATDLRGLMEGRRLWCHGHTHSCFDYVHRGCRVVCNPRGYPGERDDFQNHLVVEL